MDRRMLDANPRMCEWAWSIDGHIPPSDKGTLRLDTLDIVCDIMDQQIEAFYWIEEDEESVV